MLKGKENDLLYLLPMLESLEKIITYGRCADKAEDFYEYNDQVNFNAVLTLLLHTGEIVSKPSDDLLKNSKDMEWNGVRALRHRIAHDYVGLEIAIIFKTVKEDVPELVNKLYKITALRIKKVFLMKMSLKGRQRANIIGMLTFQN
ncbi:MAG: DUF86 domain-containing protein [Nitrospinota bacterium]